MGNEAVNACAVQRAGVALFSCSGCGRPQVTNKCNVPRFFIFTALMEIKQLLENTLRKEPNYLTDNGDIKKWVVISKAQNFDKTLLSLLINEPRLKAEFFREIQNHWIFDQNRFADFIEQKEYLEDSFTRYKTKLG